MKSISEENYTIYNSHVHTFNLNHVHNKFTKGMFLFNLVIPISFFRRFGLLRWILRRLENSRNQTIKRLAYFIIHAYNVEANRVKSQKEILADLKSYYPRRTKFIVLTMDLDFMINGKEQKNSRFNDQLRDLVKMKDTKVNKNIVYPFIHADPRRIEKYPFFQKRLRVYLQKKIFYGIKIYPALGYFPFDKRLKPVYDFALEHNLPITSHCSIGPVFYRGKRKHFKNHDFYRNNALYHPKTGKKLPGRKPKYYTQHFTHPLNYLCLFDSEFLSEYWNISREEAEKYKKLKICLGHFGGSDEWMKYLKDPWNPRKKSPLNIKEWNHTIEREGFWYRWSRFFFPKSPQERPSWFSIISEMLLKYPNLYADVSYSLSDAEMDPLLKLLLTKNKKLGKKILFGTDFYMVSTQGAERELSIRLRSYLGEELFKQIANENPKVFIKSKIK